MERFRLRVRHEPKRGDIWELQLFPDEPRALKREASARKLVTCSAPPPMPGSANRADPAATMTEPIVSGLRAP